MSETPKSPLQNQPPFGADTQWAGAHSGDERDPHAVGPLADKLLKAVDAAASNQDAPKMTVEEATEIVRAGAKGEPVSSELLARARQIVGAQTPDV